MGSTLTLAMQWLRQFVTDGVPSSGFNNPKKSEGLAFAQDADTRLGNLEASVETASLVVVSWAALNAISGSFPMQRAEVYNDGGTHTDPVTSATGVANNGIYSWSASPAGWRWVSADSIISKAPIDSPVFTTSAEGPTPSVDDNSVHLATTAYVIGQLSASGDGTPAMDGSAARGTSIHGARADHRHPTDTGIAAETTRAEAAEATNASAIAAETTRAEAAEATNASAIAAETTRAETAEATKAPLASPALTGTPTAPTAAAHTNTTQVATTAYVEGELAAVVTQSLGNNSTNAANTAFFQQNAPLVAFPAAAGTGNALTIASSLVAAWNTATLYCAVPVAYNAPGATGVVLNSLSSLPLVENDNSPPRAKRLRPGEPIFFRYSAEGFLYIVSPDLDRHRVEAHIDATAQAMSRVKAYSQTSVGDQSPRTR